MPTQAASEDAAGRKVETAEPFLEPQRDAKKSRWVASDVWGHLPQCFRVNLQSSVKMNLSPRTRSVCKR